MLVEQARAAARQWVLDEGACLPGFAGAILTGLTLWAAEGEVLGPGSDVDVMVALDVSEPPTRLGKFVYGDVLLEVSFITGQALDSPERVLCNYHLAGSFHLPCVLADPTRHLTEVHTVVSRHFAERRWVLARCANAMERVRTWITG